MTISQPVSSAGSTPGMRMACDSNPFISHLPARLRKMRADGLAQQPLLYLDRLRGVHHLEPILLNDLFVFDQDARLEHAVRFLDVGAQTEIHAGLVPLELRTPRENAP